MSKWLLTLGFILAAFGANGFASDPGTTKIYCYQADDGLIFDFRFELGNDPSVLRSVIMRAIQSDESTQAKVIGRLESVRAQDERAFQVNPRSETTFPFLGFDMGQVGYEYNHLYLPKDILDRLKTTDFADGRRIPAYLTASATGTDVVSLECISEK